MASNTTVDGYTVDENGCWTVNGQIQTKKNVDSVQFVDFSSYFNTDLHTFAKQLGYSEESLANKIAMSRHTLELYTFPYGGAAPFHLISERISVNDKYQDAVFSSADSAWMNLMDIGPWPVVWAKAQAIMVATP